MPITYRIVNKGYLKYVNSVEDEKADQNNNEL
jgi:hypothetical protein